MIAKSLTWKITGLIVLAGIMMFLTDGNWEASAKVAIPYHIVQLGLYFLHEYGWNQTQWGKHDKIIDTN